jgi:putative hydrolase of the HAD superfamily
MSYTAFLESWVAVSEALDRWPQETGREYTMEQVAVQFLTRVCPHHQSRDFATQLWMSYLREWSVPIQYIPGARDLCEDLSRHFRLGVVTNTHYAPLIHTHLRASGIAPYVSVVVTSVEHGRPKPHPSIFASALARLGCVAEAAIFVGDSYAADYLGAKGAGMAALLIDPLGSTNVPTHGAIGSVLDVTKRIVHAV